MLQDNCDHKRWSIPDSAPMGMGYCHDCKKQVWVCDLFDNLRKRMEKATTDAEAIISRLGQVRS